jgi:hypothetical protein
MQMNVLAVRGFSEIAADFQVNWPIYVSMPIVAALIGWVTKIVAIEMMFRPLDFVGVTVGRIPLGWQASCPAVPGASRRSRSTR